MRRFVVGDIHGNAKGLKQALDRSPITKDDLLITIGDICDGYSGVSDCVDLLLQYPNRIDIMGNHDEPFLQFIKSGIHSWGWQHGGQFTAISYLRPSGRDHMITRIEGDEDRYMTSLNPEDIPVEHQKFFKRMIQYHVTEDRKCFVHGGFDPDFPIEDQYSLFLMWDRKLWRMRREGIGWGKNVNGFQEIFIGHTNLLHPEDGGVDFPLNKGEVWNVDTGAGFAGRVTIMDIDSKEYWQSDLAEILYPEEKGRRTK